MSDAAVCPSEVELLAFVAAGLDSPAASGLARHVDDCAACRAALAALARAATSHATPDTVPAASISDSPARELVADDRVGRYVVRRVIGQGGMGVVYEAHDPQLARRVALKVLRPHVAAHNPERLLREAQALARLAHPNVVTVFDAGVASGQVFLAMELVPGGTLRTWLARPERTRTEVLAALVAAGRGLQAAHERGLVHRDFKPDNVLVAEGGRFCVTDFGLAAPGGEGAPAPSSLRASELIDVPLTASGQVLGTPGYMAYEQHCGEVADRRADVFAFAVVVFEALVGARPFAGATREELVAAMRAERVVWRRGRFRVGARLRRVLERGLACERDARSRSLGPLLDALERELAPRRRALFFGAFAGLLGALGLALVAFGVRGRSAAEAESLAPPSAAPSSSAGAPSASTPACDEGRVLVRAAWSEGARAAMRAALEAAGPRGTEAFAREATVLDAWSQRFEAQYRASCEAAHERADPELAARVAACFRDELAVTAALVAILGEPGQASGADVAGASELATLATCANLDLVRAEPADEPEDAGPVELESAIARAAALVALDLHQAAHDTLTHALGARALESYAPRAAANAAALLAESERALGLAGADGWLERAERLARAAGSREISGGVHAQQGAALLAANPGAARARFEQALADYGEFAGLRQPKTAVLARLALALAATGEFAPAERLLARAAGLLDGTSRAALVAVEEAHVFLEGARGRPEQAIAHLERLGRIWDEALGAAHPVALGARAALARALVDAGQREEGEAAARAVLLGQERALGGEHPDMLPALDAVAQALVGAERFDEALAVELRAIAILERATPALLGERRRDLPVALGNASELAHRLGREPQARELGARAEAACTRVAADPSCVPAAIAHQASALIETNAFREVLALVTRALSDEGGGRADADTLPLLELLHARAAAGLGRRPEAVLWGQKALGHLPAESPNAAVVSAYLKEWSK